VSKLPSEPSSELTPYDTYLRRREFIKRAAAFVGVSAAWGAGLTALSGRGRPDKPKPPSTPKDAVWTPTKSDRFGIEDELTPFGDVTSYNNYYELGLDKSTPSHLGHMLVTRPWTVRVAGEIAEPRELDLDTLIKWFGLEERVYRMRCVEAWSMVIPWLGFPLAALVKRLEPTSRAKYVEMTTLLDARQLPNQESRVLPWPYVEALRMDEALNPLTLLAVGLYGAPLLGQNGAPLRLVVPWKYGFKGVKSIVQIRFTEERPKTTWNLAGPSEYGFYANVNPNVDHPRWSQANERRIGELSRRPTVMFNGYGEWVANLYANLDLRKNF
jgi:methionine sulfoxide reductase catalytic subunit